jgi:hypothetical protein
MILRSHKTPKRLTNTREMYCFVFILMTVFKRQIYTQHLFISVFPHLYSEIYMTGYISAVSYTSV